MTTVDVAHQFDDAPQQNHAVSLGMWLFLASELLIFSVLFTAYATARWMYPEAFAQAGHHLYKWIGVTNTAVLLLSSGAMAMAVESPPNHGGRKAAWMSATATLGLAFLFIKAIEYTLDAHEHLVPGVRFDADPFTDPPHAALFLVLYWIMTGLHALHVLAGVGVISVMAFRTWIDPNPARLHNAVHAAGLYWHFVDIIWLILLPLLYLNP
jgi:cytochrome c oxidase subunit 3